MRVETERFGILPGGQEAHLFHLHTDNGMSVSISDYGCTVTSLVVPDRNGLRADIVTGYRTWEEWLQNPAYFGSIIGRVCNRIGNARFSIDGIEYKVTPNHKQHQLHGGISGFDKKLWSHHIRETGNQIDIEFHYLSADGEEGFPGNMEVWVTYSLSNENTFAMIFRATTDKPGPVNLTNHCYFNLRGEGSGAVYDQELEILADFITETDADSIPTGKLLAVEGTAFDFTASHPVGQMIHSLPKGYDDNFVLRNQSGTTQHMITAYDPVSGRELKIFTSEPGVQLYTSNWFDGSITGKSGNAYLEHGAFALETQHYPDSVNHPSFPGIVLRPGQTYQSETIWKFSTR